jgi:hypothetical protein
MAEWLAAEQHADELELRRFMRVAELRVNAGRGSAPVLVTDSNPLQVFVFAGFCLIWLGGL